MRTIPDELAEALASQAGNAIFRVNTWADQAAYQLAPTVPENTWEVLDFEIFSTSASAKLASENDYTLSAFTVFIVERGLEVNGVEYTVESGLYFVTYYREDYGTIEIKGSSYPNIKIYITNGDGTYQEVIEDFCAEIGKTARFKNSSDTWLDYQFIETGKFVRNNKAERFETLIRQKYTILVYEESPESLVFYTLDSYLRSEWKSIDWSPSLELLVAVASAGNNGATISEDGETWEGKTTPAYYNAITWHSSLSLWVAVGVNVCATSPDGVTWTARTIPAGTYNAVCAHAFNFHAVGNDVAAFSGDGFTWSTKSIPTGNYNAVASAGGLVYAVGDNVSAYFFDPTGWFTLAIPTGNYKSMYANITGSKVVAVGENVCATLPIGGAWTARTIPERVWESVVFASTLALYVAIASSGENRIAVSPDGINWTMFPVSADFILTYEDGPKSYIIRSQSEMHYIWDDELGVDHTSGDISTPQWNLGFLPSTAEPPDTNTDPYYKMFLQKAPVRLDITDGDKIHFVPFWSVDPSQTIDAMVIVSEHFHPSESPSWYQSIQPIILFDKGEAG